MIVPLRSPNSGPNSPCPPFLTKNRGVVLRLREEFSTSPLGLLRLHFSSSALASSALPHAFQHASVLLDCNRLAGAS